MADNMQQQWILEFLLRQPIEDDVMNRLISALSPSICNHRLIKTLILRSVSSEIQKGLISERTLESLELIEEIDYLQGVRVLDSMKESYCLVAMDCAVKFLKTNPKNFSEYIKVIDRVWRGRMLDLERGKEVSLTLRWAQDLRSELDKAVHDASVCEHLSMEDTRNEALKSLGIFVEQVTEKMGPSFLELAAKMVRNPSAASPSSLMELKNTAHSFEGGNDKSEQSFEGSPNRSLLPTRKSRLVSPSSRQQIQNIPGRRKHKKWSSLEEQTLIDAVKEYGSGNWKLILNNYKEIFEGRTMVNLKDKWRNLTK